MTIPKIREELYRAIGYQEDAKEATNSFPKSFVAYAWEFRLGSLSVEIRDETLPNPKVMTLSLTNVNLDITQRPSARNLVLSMALEKLWIEGHKSPDRHGHPIITRTVAQQGSQLLEIEVENNPPDKPEDLDNDKGSLTDMRVKASSCPLEITYDKKTFKRFLDVFHNPQVSSTEKLLCF